MKQTFSPRELAHALGVSESSLKRWTDDGLLRARRTAGGHRRIPLTEAVRFLRERRTPLARPELLGLAETSPAADPAEQLFEHLRGGHSREARGLIVGRFLQGRSVASICDDEIRGAMMRIGNLWQHDDEGIFYEHRATDICMQALHQLSLMIETPASAPAAVGGAPAGDPYVLPSLSAAVVLKSEGIRATNLGPDTPIESLLVAVREQRAGLAWLCISSFEKQGGLVADLRRAAEGLAGLDARLAVGGRGAGQLDLPALPNVHVGSSMTELAAFAKGALLGRD